MRTWFFYVVTCYYMFLHILGKKSGRPFFGVFSDMYVPAIRDLMIKRGEIRPIDPHLSQVKNLRRLKVTRVRFQISDFRLGSKQAGARIRTSK